MLSTTSPQSQTTSTRPNLDRDALQARFGDSHRLPRELREEAAGMDWALFSAVYAPSSDLRITQLHPEKLRGGMYRFHAETLRTSKTTLPESETTEIIATGAVSACTHLLAEQGRRIEIRSFHQLEIFEATATFIKSSDDRREYWAFGFGPTPEASIASALSSAGQRLYA